MEMHQILKRRRAELRLSQEDLASKVGVDKRQIGRWESGNNQPTLGVAAELARALGISLDELVGNESPRRIDLTGDWWANWQTWNKGDEVLNQHEVRMAQRGDLIEIEAITRGTPFEQGGYLWSGEMRVFDNEALIGWYSATEEAVRSKGSLYFSLHQHGAAATGRWVGLSFDGPIISGWSVLARTREDVERLMQGLIEQDGR